MNGPEPDKKPNDEQDLKSLLLKSKPLGRSSLEFKRKLLSKDEPMEREHGYPLEVFLVSRKT